MLNVRAYCVLCMMLCWGGGNVALAVQAFDGLFVIEQPDGHSFSARTVGDEWRNATETAAGYVVSKSSTDACWYYVIGYDKNNVPVLSNVPAQSEPPATLKKHLLPRLKKYLRILK